MIKKRTASERISGFFCMSAVLLIFGCPGPQDPDPVIPSQEISAQEDSGTLSMTIRGLLHPTGGVRALLSAQKAGVVLTAPDGGEYTRLFSLPPGSQASLIWEGLLPGTGWKVRVDLYNTYVSEESPQVSGVGTFNIEAGKTTSVTVVCTPVDPHILDSGGFPVTSTLAAGGEAWHRLSLTSEGRHTFSVTGAGGLARFFTPGGTLNGEASEGKAWTWETTAPEDLVIGVFSSGGGEVTVGLTSLLPPVNEGTPESPVALEADLDFRLFRMGASGGGAETSVYAIQAEETGSWWLDMPYSSEYQWSLFSGDSPSALLASGANSTGLKFSLEKGENYLLVLKNVKASKDLKISGRLLTPGLAVQAAVGDGTPGNPKALSLDREETLKIGGRNFDCNGWYTFTAGESGWQELRFGEAGTGSYTVELHTGQFTGPPLVTWSNTENLVQKVKLTPGIKYFMKASGQFSSGIKDTAWPVTIKSAPLSPTADLPPETWNVLELAAGGADWVRVPVTGGQWYLVSWDDKTQGSGAFTGDIRISAYGRNRDAPYFVAKDKGWSTRWLVQIPDEDTELFLLAQGFSPSSSGTYALKASLEGGGISVEVQ